MMIAATASAPIDILLVEDNPGDVRLTKEALRDAKVLNTLTVAVDGVEALAALRKAGRFADAPRPDIILLDLNLPRKDGREVLAAAVQALEDHEDALAVLRVDLDAVVTYREQPLAVPPSEGDVDRGRRRRPTELVRDPDGDVEERG